MAPNTSNDQIVNNSTTSSGKSEIIIDGKWVDVTSFMKRHPGGKVITFLIGTDGTQAFHEFHQRSERAYKILKNLPSRPIEDKDEKPSELVKDFDKLRQDLVKEGYFDPSLSHVFYRIAEVIFLHALGVYLLHSGFGNLSFALGLIVLGVVQGRCGWLMHEGGHYSMTGNIVIDKTLQEVLYGIGCGMSASWWRSQHNRHHATPQKIKHDVDLETLPLVAFNEKIIRRVKKNQILLRTWLSLQAYLFAPITCFLVAIGWQLFLHVRHIIRTKQINEAIALSMRYYLVFGVVLAKYSWSQSILYYSIYVWIGAMYIFLNFAFSHTHKPVISENEHIDWVRYASNHTTNVTPSWWCNWLMGYLNFQIEHHLFPTMPQFRHPLIAPRVKKLFEKHGLQYDVRSYAECVSATFANLQDVANYHFE